MSELSKVLKLLRMRKLLTLQEMSKQLGVASHTVVINWEKGRFIPEERFLRYYANIFMVEYDDLIKLREKAMYDKKKIRETNRQIRKVR